MDIVTCDKDGIRKIIKSYENGEIIAFPKDTVYGCLLYTSDAADE